jgi:nitrous oxidase accessory protein
MRWRSSALLALASAWVVFGPSPFGAATASAREWLVNATPGAAARALASASDGDTVRFAPGVHAGPLRVNHALTLRGTPGAVIDGGGRGTVLEIAAAHTVVEDLEIRGSGKRVISIDGGIRLINATDVTLRRLRIRDVLYGIYAERSDRLLVERCTLAGRVEPLDELGEGNGIHLWYCEDARLTENAVSGFVDGVYLSFANHLVSRANVLSRCGRYGLHTMYCQGTRLIGNRFAHNLAGCAIMFTNHLDVHDNDFLHNRGPRTYGLLLRDCSDGSFTNNRLVDNTVALFMDNSNRNEIRDNLIQDNGWGLLIFSSCDANVIAGNAFLNDDYPVALDMRRTNNCFDDGARGNYWSENAAYDLDADGVSDAPYSPVSAFAFVSKQYPDLSVLAKSPAVLALAVAERVFPALSPSEAVDRHPLVRPAARSRGTSVESARFAPSWAGAAGFVLLALTGVLGLRAGRRAT